MAAALAVYQTSVGKKFVMAITGVIGYLFVIIHMIGNLKVFLGPQAFNDYSEFLRTVGEPALPARTLLWIVRLVLLASVTFHVIAAVQLSRQSQVGRQVAYRQKKRVQANIASVTMRWGGVAIFLFIIYHLLQFTFGVVHPDFRELNNNGITHPEAYHNLVVGFQNPIVVLFYLLAIGALGMHLYHGVWSLFQTLGINRPQWNGLFRGLAVLSGIVLFLGFAIVPLSVLFGIVR